MTPIPQNISSTSEREPILYNLIIRLDAGFQHITAIWIFTGDKRLLHTPTGDLQSSQERVYRIPKGVYIVRVDINAQVEDTTISINGDTEYKIGDRQQGVPLLKTPKLYSSALLYPTAIGQGGLFETSHEYYTNPAVRISMRNTMPLKPDMQTNCGLFLFLRFPSTEMYRRLKAGKSYWNKFSLYNDRKELICRFPQYTYTGEDETREFPGLTDSGFLGYSSDLPPGLYFLRYKNGQNAREVPIYVYRRWYTQVFITVGREPLFGTTRIFLSREKKFDPSNRYHLFIDICLNKIQNNDYTIDRELLQNIAYGKYESPMLGLVGAFLYLKSKETKDDEIFRTIVRNLQEVILGDNEEAPDLWALRLISREHFNEPVTYNAAVPTDGTPMLRIAYDSIRRAAAVDQSLVRPNSLNDLIAENQVFDSPYNTFRPTKKHKLINQKRSDDAENQSDFLESRWSAGVSDFQTPSFNLLISSEEPETKKTLLDYIEENKLSVIETASSYGEYAPESVSRSAPKKLSGADQLKFMTENPEKTGWVGYSIALQLTQQIGATSQQLAELINVPITTIERIRKKNRI